jgi:hypothetical protein
LYQLALAQTLRRYDYEGLKNVLSLGMETGFVGLPLWGQAVELLTGMADCVSLAEES